MITICNPRFRSIFCMILCIFLRVGNSIIKECEETNKQALLKLKDCFIDEGNILFSWKSEVDCCQWKGISCDNLTGQVTKLDLGNPYFEMRGNINSSLCELQHLTYLDLSYNNFEGQKIPKCIGSLHQLRELKLATTSINGNIPHELGNLSNLHTLDLGFNSLIANDLHWISQLSSLRYLDLSYVDLSKVRDWQSSISSLPSILKLYLDSCKLPQVGSKLFPHMNSSTSLKILSLRGTLLDSSDLSWVFNCSKVLLQLDLSYNSLQHIVPDAFANMISLEYLDLSYNELESSIAKSFTKMFHLKVLWLSFNKLSDQLTDWIQKFGHAHNRIEELDISNNPFSNGPFPDFSRFPYLKILVLSNTGLCGSIPPSFGHLPHLSDLFLSHNKLSGPLPEFMGLSKLATLDLSNNQFTEILPATLGQLSSLVTLRINSNKLKGVVSEAHLSSLSKLLALDVSYNFMLTFNFSLNWVPPFQLRELLASSCILGPDFPMWLKYQKQLKELDISDGKISDSIPEWFWDQSLSLSYLNLSHNKIHGALPRSLPQTKVYFSVSDNIWDLSFNNLSGPLPHCSPTTSVLDLSNNMFSGSISSFCPTSNTNLLYLDLSSNLISGRLADCWGQFQFLRVLNLAKNNISGRVPNSIGSLMYIQSIHLNNNNLYGKFPSLINSPRLRFIDFGQNNLHGMLPTWIGNKLPNLIVLRLQANKFQGSLPTSLCNLLLLQILDLSQNNFSGIIPHCINNSIALSNIKLSRKTLISYSIREDFLSNNSVRFLDDATLVYKGEDVDYRMNLGIMTAIDLSCNQLQGDIPNSITTLMALASLNLSRNNLTGFIPNKMGQMKMLESLDLSRNSLSGEIPKSLVALTFLSYLNLSFNNLSGKIPQSTQLQTFDASTYIGNHLWGPPLSQLSPKDAISVPSPRTDDTGEGDELISFGFYISMIAGFIIGFWGVCGTLTGDKIFSSSSVNE